MAIRRLQHLDFSQLSSYICFLQYVKFIFVFIRFFPLWIFCNPEPIVGLGMYGLLTTLFSMFLNFCIIIIKVACEHHDAFIYQWELFNLFGTLLMCCLGVTLFPEIDIKLLSKSSFRYIPGYNDVFEYLPIVILFVQFGCVLIVVAISYLSSELNGQTNGFVHPNQVPPSVLDCIRRRVTQWANVHPNLLRLLHRLNINL